MSDVAGNGGSGEYSESDYGERKPPVKGKSTPNTPRTAAENKYATCTESLGFESINEKANVLMAESSSTLPQTVEYGVGVESRSRSRKIERKSSSSEMNNFPPLLSTLNRKGRPRFNLVKIRENGRLQIHMVPNKRPELVQSVEPSGRLTLSFINGDNRHGQDDDELEECSNREEENKIDRSSGDDKEEELHGCAGNDASLS